MFLGGDIIVMTLTSHDIVQNSDGSEGKWRFFFYGFIILLPEVLPQWMNVIQTSPVCIRSFFYDQIYHLNK